MFTSWFAPGGHASGANPCAFGNAVYVDLAIGNRFAYLNRKVRLAAMDKRLKSRFFMPPSLLDIFGNKGVSAGRQRTKATALADLEDIGGHGEIMVLDQSMLGLPARVRLFALYCGMFHAML